MTSRISRVDEARLTNAIEKAASLASVNDGLNRTELLADTLRQSNIDNRFAKVAAAAFNKTLTVHTLAKAADAHKADDFELADPDGVYELLGGHGVRKTASFRSGEGSFTISYEEYVQEPRMSKAASAPVPPAPYEQRVDYNVLRDHVESVMDKCAAEFGSLNAACETLDSRLNAEAMSLCGRLCKAANGDAMVRRMVGMYGSDFAGCMLSKLQGSGEMHKDAGFREAGIGDISLYADAERLAKHAADLRELRDFTGRFGLELSEFCKAAAFMGDTIATAENRGLHKEAAGGLQGFIGRAAARSVFDATKGYANFLEHSAKGLSDLSDTASDSLSTSIGVLDETRKKKRSPYDFVDADFIIRDRANDKLMAWSDMTADPVISMYPSSQIFDAVNTAVAMDPSMGTPPKRELLRTYVSQLLAQNGRQSTADLAALSETVKNMNESAAKATVTDPLSAVKELEKVEPMSGGIGTFIKGVSGGVGNGLTGIGTGISSLTESFKEGTGKLVKYMDERAATRQEEAMQRHNADVDAKDENSISLQIGKIHAQTNASGGNPPELGTRHDIISWMSKPENGGLEYWRRLSRQRDSAGNLIGSRMLTLPGVRIDPVTGAATYDRSLGTSISIADLLRSAPRRP